MKVKNSQKGFTLLEILVAMAVSGLLLTGVVGAIFQTLRITAESRLQITALEDIKNVAYWVGKDMVSANATNLVSGGPAVSNLTLQWTNYPYAASGNFAPVNHSVSYTQPSAEIINGVEYKIIRRYYDSDPATIVGRHISAIQFSRAGNIITAVITSSPEGSKTAEQRTYQFYLQPKGSLAQ